MSFQPRQDELYEDLSIILVLIKKIFKNMLLKDSQQEICKSRETINQQAIINSRCTQLIIRYKKANIRRIEYTQLINRFMCRVKEIIKQITVCIPKDKIQILIILKKMELLTQKSITIDNGISMILSLLEIVSTCNIKLIHSLKIKPANTPKEQKSTEKTLEKQISYRDEGNQQKHKKGQMVESQLDITMKNIEKYSIVGIDKEFFRGRYFDLKTENNNSVFEQAMLRNRNIRNLMNRFQKDHSKFKSRSNSNFSSPKSNDKKKTICWQITPQQQSSNLFFKRQVSSRSANTRIPLNKSNQTLTYNSFEESAEIGIETYRSMYESKTMRSRAKETIKMNNTIIDVPSIVTNPNANMINAKRWNFYKKSQEHLKFRYKYAQNKNNTINPLIKQYGNANPQLLYTIAK